MLFKDFLESVIEQEPRPRLKRRNLVPQEIQQLKEATPNLKHGSSSLFRSLRDKGIVSYTEYLFLLSVLTSKLIWIHNKSFINKWYF